MQSTVTGPYRSGIYYVHKDNRLDMVRDDYKLGDPLNGVAIHECGPDTRGEITQVKYATTIN